jgi:hypothetical protein
MHMAAAAAQRHLGRWPHHGTAQRWPPTIEPPESELTIMVTPVGLLLLSALPLTLLLALPPAAGPLTAAAELLAAGSEAAEAEAAAKYWGDTVQRSASATSG